MSSWVLFKFKSSKEPTRINFDGTGITVFELKREIITASQLGDGTDFDLHIYDEGSNEEYTDDTAIIPRSSMVVARRVPASRSGHGKAARYVSGRMPIHARRNDPKTKSGADALTAMSNAKTETEKIAALFAAEGDMWAQQQQEMAHAKAVPLQFKGQKRPTQPERPLPPGYICHRCQQKGHWIYDCPTNEDPNFVPKPKLKKTTGIPRSFLERVEKVDDDEEEGKNYMLDADGNRVRVKTDTATWEKEQARQKASAAKKEAAAEADKELQERGLECSIDHRLFDVPTKTPCCSKTYCYQCIEDALVNNDLVCPNCGTENVLIDDLRPDNEMALKIKAYRDEKRTEDEAKQAVEAAEAKAQVEAVMAEAKKVEEEKAKQEEVTKTIDDKDADEDEGTELKNTDNVSLENDDDVVSSISKTKKRRSNSPARSTLSVKSTAMERTTSTESSRKRPAEEDLNNERVPTAPAAMRKQQEQVKQTQEGLLPQFLEDMEKFTQNGLNAFIGSSQPNQSQVNSTSIPMMSNPMMAMTSGMNPMMMGIPNMMNMGMMGQMDSNMNMNIGMNMGMPNMPNMSNIPNMNMGYQNGGCNQGYQNNNGNWQQQGYNNNWNNGGRGRGRGYQNNNYQTQYSNGGYQNNFNNNQGGPQRGGFRQGNFNKDHPNEEEDPYFRQPVNPHRHQQRKRMRPSEYTELGGGN